MCFLGHIASRSFPWFLLRSHHRRKNTWSSGDLSGLSSGNSRGGAQISWVERERNRFGNASSSPGNTMGHPSRRTSFGGRRAGSFNVLSSVKEVMSTPGSSITDIHLSVSEGNIRESSVAGQFPLSTHAAGEEGKDRTRRVVINSNVISSVISSGSDEVVMENPVYGGGPSGSTGFHYDVIEMSALETPGVEAFPEEVTEFRELGSEMIQKKMSHGSVTSDNVFESIDVIVHQDSDSTRNLLTDDEKDDKNNGLEDEELASGGSADTFNTTLTYSPGHMIRNIES